MYYEKLSVCYVMEIWLDHVGTDDASKDILQSFECSEEEYCRNEGGFVKFSIFKD